jgi:hypothetical protein
MGLDFLKTVISNFMDYQRENPQAYCPEAECSLCSRKAKIHISRRSRMPCVITEPCVSGYRIDIIRIKHNVGAHVEGKLAEWRQIAAS